MLCGRTVSPCQMQDLFIVRIERIFANLPGATQHPLAEFGRMVPGAPGIDFVLYPYRMIRFIEKL